MLIEFWSDMLRFLLAPLANLLAIWLFSKHNKTFCVCVLRSYFIKMKLLFGLAQINSKYRRFIFIIVPKPHKKHTNKMFINLQMYEGWKKTYYNE